MPSQKNIALIILCLAVAVSSSKEEHKYGPRFVDTEQDKQTGDYIFTRGSSTIKCEFDYEPLTFTQKPYESKPEIDEFVADKFNMQKFVLRLRRVGDEENVLVEDTLTLSGSIGVDTDSLDKNGVYSCCLEYADTTKAGLCSYLKFDKQLASPMNEMTADAFFGKTSNVEQQEHLFKITQVFDENQARLNQAMHQTMRVYKLARNVLVVLVMTVTFAILVGIVSWKVAELRRSALVRKHQQLMGGAAGANALSGECFTIRMPPTSAHTSNVPSLYDELYVKYNLNTQQVDCGSEFPPAYDDVENEPRGDESAVQVRVQKF